MINIDITAPEEEAPRPDPTDRFICKLRIEICGQIIYDAIIPHLALVIAEILNCLHIVLDDMRSEDMSIMTERIARLTVIDDRSLNVSIDFDHFSNSFVGDACSLNIDEMRVWRDSFVNSLMFEGLIDFKSIERHLIYNI